MLPFVIAPPPTSPGPVPVLQKDANYSVQAGDVISGRVIIQADATSGAITIEVPVALGSNTFSPVIVILKTDETDNQVIINDGTNALDFIGAPASAQGQINGWREVTPDGTFSWSRGVG
jgi:hypothetical protein